MEVYKRNYTIDIFRLIASFFIVFLHVGLEGLDEGLLAIVRISGRWGVPFFFLLSGYFLHKGLLKAPYDTFKKNCIKIITILIVADVIFIVTQYVVNGTFNWMHLFPGAYFHLWFLPSLVLGTGVLYLYNKLKLSAVVSLGTGFLVIIIVLLADSYSFFLNLENKNLSGRVIPLLSIPFMTLGFFFFENLWFRRFINKRSGLLLILFGFLLQVVEMKLINVCIGRPMIEHQFLLGTVFLSVGVFILALSMHFKNETLGVWGRDYSLFIYLYHPLVVIICYQTNYKSIFFGNSIILLPVVIFLITLFVGLFMNKYLNEMFLILTGSIKRLFLPFSIRS